MSMMTQPAATAMRFCFSLRQASPQKPTGGPESSSASRVLVSTGSKRSRVSVICLLPVSISPLLSMPGHADTGINYPVEDVLYQVGDHEEDREEHGGSYD